jgi:histidine triad (HIT) family protein
VDHQADCIFCRILSGKAPASFIYRDDLVAAFMDIQPVNLGHVLVVPVRHAPLMSDVTAQEAGAMMRVAHDTTAALRASTLQCEGVNYFLADGEAAMQEVFHAHLHVFPRFKGDGFGLRFSEAYYTRRPPRPELDQQAAELRTLLRSG